MGNLFFDGRWADEFGIVVSGEGSFAAPERDRDTEEVPGRSGALHFDNGRFRNVKIEYVASVARNFRRKAPEIRAWLLSPTSYARLGDTYDTDCYRMAVCESVEFTPGANNHTAEMKIVFDCKPQRFLKSGEIAITQGGNGQIINPTQFDALPLLRLRPVPSATKLTATINGVTVEIKLDNATDEYIEIDCETMNVSQGTRNLNSATIAPEFPVLKSGENETSYTNMIIGELYGRWWTI